MSKETAKKLALTVLAIAAMTIVFGAVGVFVIPFVGF